MRFPVSVNGHTTEVKQSEAYLAVGVLLRITASLQVVEFLSFSVQLATVALSSIDELLTGFGCAVLGLGERLFELARLFSKRLGFVVEL